ncbi:hypothetical protein J4Q44_G00297080 [Coregonus suidteri]|uniref:Receptor activity-modifying protein 3 n=1 Tax=Coregonus suidteri TaxID=861788 RepID=A0AAN8QC92_9TELE
MHLNRVCGTFIHDVMDTNALAVLKLLVVGILVNPWMTKGLSATENINVESIPRRPSVALCNETQLLWEMEMCGEGFKQEMAYVDPQNWCNLTHFISEYHLFSQCTETNAERINCYWPNPLVESYIIRNPQALLLQLHPAAGDLGGPAGRHTHHPHSSSLSPHPGYDRAGGVVQQAQRQSGLGCWLFGSHVTVSVAIQRPCEPL